MSVLVASNGRRPIPAGVVGAGIGAAVALVIVVAVVIALAIPAAPGAAKPVAPAGAAAAPNMHGALREHSLRENAGTIAAPAAAAAAGSSAVSDALREHTLREHGAAAGAGGGAAGAASTAPDRLRGHLEREWRTSGTITTGGSSSISQELYNHSLRENRAR